ncbi:MAG: SoxR reducing system RseC family protein [Zetaproteobacteria bacterium]|nr:SoxR reducing system RseC family protein [Zetaproteobacteria bacterium]
MQQIVYVTQTLTENHQPFVIVESTKASACHSCAGQSSCSTLGAWNERTLHLKLANTLHAKVGDQLLLEAPDQAVVKMALHLYGKPMVGFFIAAMVGYALASWLGWATDLSSAVAGVLGIVAVYRWQAVNAAERAAAFDVRMVEVIARNDACTAILPLDAESSSA